MTRKNAEIAMSKGWYKAPFVRIGGHTYPNVWWHPDYGNPLQPTGGNLSGPPDYEAQYRRAQKRAGEGSAFAIKTVSALARYFEPAVEHLRPVQSLKGTSTNTSTDPGVGKSADITLSLDVEIASPDAHEQFLRDYAARPLERKSCA